MGNQQVQLLIPPCSAASANPTSWGAAVGWPKPTSLSTSQAS